ncbi:hypothetical protein GCM10010472_57220 [Pseudonocardia halophobica]|uniref:Uncharacterized protein n=1 Tax=Pseudonocardia halophobica TaxID=29401 RepID=A0A9W6L400_9PSEU|nr:hypothetical protein GCM10017577_39440 [Pseudonocardia halophobica]
MRTEWAASSAQALRSTTSGGRLQPRKVSSNCCVGKVERRAGADGRAESGTGWSSGPDRAQGFRRDIGGVRDFRQVSLGPDAQKDA